MMCRTLIRLGRRPLMKKSTRTYSVCSMDNDNEDDDNCNDNNTIVTNMNKKRGTAKALDQSKLSNKLDEISATRNWNEDYQVLFV